MPNSSSRSIWRGPLLVLGLLAGLATALAFYHYFTGDDYTLRVQEVTQLKPVPLVVQQVLVGLDALPVRANGYLATQTHDVSGPFVRADAAAALLVLLAACLAYYLAVVSTLPRATFVAGMALLIFLLMSLNADLLGLIDSREQYFLIVMLLALGLPAFGFHAFWTQVPLGPRLLVFGALVAALGTFIFLRTAYPSDTTALHLVSFATASGAIIVALLVLWVAFENIQGLLWFNTQAENPGSRFGLLPFVLASGLYLGMLFLYYWNNGEVFILPNVRLEPLVLLLPAVAIGWLSLRRRAATYGAWVPYWPGAAHLYLILTALAAGFLGYAFATANDPLLSATRDFTALALLMVGAAFLLYVLVNFGPLIKQRLRVYRVVYEPRRLPFYAVYLLGLAGIFAVELRNNFFVLDQVRAGYYNNLGDLTRLQSEQPRADALALLAERYYAESDALDLHNHRASWGRAALYRFRSQRQNEINALRRAQSRQPAEKISLRLAALFNEPTDFFDRLRLLREGLKTAPRSARLTNDLAQLYTRSTITDSVNHYFNQAEALAPNNPVTPVNKLAYMLQQQDLRTAQKLLRSVSADDRNAAWQSNAQLLQQLLGAPLAARPVRLPAAPLDAAHFAWLYHDGLRRAVRGDSSQLRPISRLAADPANSSYAEQLAFLQALTKYYAGRPAAAQTDLQPLAAGNTPGSAFYQNLGALWLLEQQLPASAAVRFQQAARNGYPEALLFRAYAQALNGQPDSARASARKAQLQKTTDLPRRAGHLLAALNFDFNQSTPLASDSGRAQYLVLRGGELPAASLLQAATVLGTPAAREAALLAQLPRALRAGQVAAAQEAIRKIVLAVTAHTLAASRWNIVRGEAYLRAGQLAELRRFLPTAYFAPLHRAYPLYYRAALAAAEAKPDAAALYAKLMRDAPFLEEAVLGAADFFARRQNHLEAYNILLTGLAHNPESIALLQAYCLATIPAGLTAYAAEPLEKLSKLLSPAEYRTFHTQYEARRSAQAAASAPWN
ncbi:hypothetical protein SAMN02745146_1105 [Hymenobacter daecheongensis DSM 21074]|uniref:Tetratricopeptide repeat-containing protein n=1 Tax=Hymenobacter daecheongensis DSM 21074 TaxID=1121955 RepID=A0A1M6CC61_9BACT|nr:hypothetical protein [Hymenobacter daecheongensis]SHI58589.1 hypothetical protein SAMN02745146_1105 [Hymenobacter daecheongensis DSM 21074]